MGADGNEAIPRPVAPQAAPSLSQQDVKRKYLRQRWSFVEPHPAEAAELAKAARLPLVLAELLVARGITQPADAFAFLNPEITHLHDPLLMLGMNAAVERLERAIAAR